MNSFGPTLGDEFLEGLRRRRFDVFDAVFLDQLFDFGNSIRMDIGACRNDCLLELRLFDGGRKDTRRDGFAVHEHAPRAPQVELQLVPLLSGEDQADCGLASFRRFLTTGLSQLSQSRLFGGDCFWNDSVHCKSQGQDSSEDSFGVSFDQCSIPDWSRVSRSNSPPARMPSRDTHLHAMVLQKPTG